MIGVSIIVCCYNSSTRLPETLSRLAKQEISDEIPMEVIVVDNASTDDTTEHALRLWQRYNSTIPLLVVKEEREGLSYARRCGVDQSNYDILIFCDDDNWLPEDYAVKAYHLMQKDDKIGVIGGFGKAVFESKKPPWFDFFQSYYAVGEQESNISVDINRFRYLYGAGMIVNKIVLQELYSKGFTNFSTDRIGSKLVSGGDIELCLAIQILGYKVSYEKTLCFHHLISATKLNFKYCAKLVSGIGYSSDLLFPYLKLYNNKLCFPFPSYSTLRKIIWRVLLSVIILLIPSRKFGHFYLKLRNTLFLYGKLKFHLTHQRYFLRENSIFDWL
ncbi:MAG TPA: glycosyltransferase [Cyclobacteriaceae bacterium]|nr:glycosyltransferase [Cyclobacteriaceae bacterium]